MDRMRRIEILVRAADSGSFARAARFLQLDPSAVSHAIKDLERELNITLFYRTTRQLRLTDEGREIYRRGCVVLRAMDELASAAVRSPGRLEGTLRIGMGVPVSRHIIMPRLPGFLRRHPGLQIECLVMTRISDMHASGVDILLQPGEPPASGVVARKIAQTRYGVYAAPAYIDSFGEPATPEDLLRHRCLVHQPPFMKVPWDDWEFERDGERRTVKVARTLVTDDREGLFAAALAGAGVIRSAMFDPQLIMSGRLRKLLRDWRCPDALNLYAIHRKAPRLPPKITAFLAFVAEAFADFDPGELTLIHVPMSATYTAGAPVQR